MDRRVKAASGKDGRIAMRLTVSQHPRQHLRGRALTLSSAVAYRSTYTRHKSDEVVITTFLAGWTFHTRISNIWPRQILIRTRQVAYCYEQADDVVCSRWPLYLATHYPSPSTCSCLPIDMEEMSRAYASCISRAVCMWSQNMPRCGCLNGTNRE